MTDDDTPPPPAASVPVPPPLVEAVRVVRLRELSPKSMWWTAAVIAVLTAGAVVVLWWPATAGLTGADLVTARLDALKIGLSIGVGGGGVVALYLAWRRQNSTEADLDNRERTLAHQQEVAAATMAHQDRVARATEHDAAERRLTELYLKAVEQLGSSQAAVRHGGLYALERVAQDNSSQRQTVVDVICAYLRNPYSTTTPDTVRPRSLGVRRPLLRSATVHSVPRSPRHAGHDREYWQQEREVRLTAQHVLRRHLQPGDAPDQMLHTFWPDITLNLTGATLIDVDLTGCRVDVATFDKATFTGDALFDRSTVTGRASFGGATFAGHASFDESNIERALFHEAIFAVGAWFLRTTIGYAVFDGATFGYAAFDLATVTDNISFDGAMFSGDASFDRATVTGDVSFGGATFTGAVSFDRAAVTGDVSFGGATFTGAVSFDDVTVTGDAWFDGATFVDDASFDRVTLTGNVSFRRATSKGIDFDPVERG
ncbi:pentapeptide repeat-containing protein [Amycolatopsis sp. NPDC024027]|uniref:pentapeptide repeat-containing protein n=1 Tax=Amycolatopsis sp. NPDC024027 TaxID=3154327 RepID=UPI0033E0B609